MFRRLFKFLSCLMIVVTFQFQLTCLMPIWSAFDTKRNVLPKNIWKLEQSEETSQESPMAERSLEQLVVGEEMRLPNESPSEYDLQLRKGQSALYKVPASLQRFDSQVHERKTEDEVAASASQSLKSVQSLADAPSSVGASQTVLVLLGYCFLLFALIAVLFFAVTGFTGSSKRKGTKREKDSDTEKMSSTRTRSKRSKSEERHRKKHKKRKHQEQEERREKDQSLDTEGVPKSESIFVPLPTDDERRGEKYRQRRKERREKRRHRREKKRAERRNTEKRERKRKRHQERLRRLEQLNSESADEASSAEPEYGEPEGTQRSLSEFPYSFLAPEGVSWSSQTFTSPETESEPHRDRNETQQEQLHSLAMSPMAGLDRNAVIFVLKSDLPQLNTDRVYISLPDDPLDGKQLPKSEFVNKPRPDKPRLDKPVTPDSDSPSPGSPPAQTTILYQSPICRTAKASGSLVRSPAGAIRSKKGAINAKAVLDAIVRPITAQSAITKDERLSEQPNAVTSSINNTNSSIIFDCNRHKRPNRPFKVTLREESSSLVRNRPKSILRRSTSSAYRHDSPESLGKHQRSLKRVSFSQQMQVRYIHENK